MRHDDRHAGEVGGGDGRERGDFYKNMFAKCPAGRPGTADEVANVAELLMSERGAFITGADILVDGGATASYFYGPLRPQD
ncbi:SDR family oxidoreductase [Bifidobacterium samirii]|nr:SDR family oxidoreductase [Bifidobacterium samirii]